MFICIYCCFKVQNLGGDRGPPGRLCTDPEALHKFFSSFTVSSFTSYLSYFPIITHCLLFCNFAKNVYIFLRFINSILLFKISFCYYNKPMEKKRKRKRNITNLTKEQKLAFRRRQVKRQKFLLTACGLFLVILIAALLFFILSRPKEDILQINAACESYRDEVTTAAAKYGMSDYVDLILAVMMQESSGQGTDVMQSAEGAYNTKYPQTPAALPIPPILSNAASRN